jgi:ABC-2 type transport system permease protein
MRMIVGAALVVVGVALGWAGLLRLAAATDVAAHVVTVTGGAAIVLGFLLAPPLVGDDQLDPRRFRPFGVTSRPLAAAVLLAGLLGVPLLALLALAVGVSVLWVQHGTNAGAAVAGPLLGVLTALLLTKVSSAATSRLLRERRSRELTGVFLLLLLIVVVPAGIFVASLDWGTSVPPALIVAARALSLTPFGAPWAIPGYAAAGDALGWAALAVAVVTVAALTVAWFAIVDRMLHSSDRPLAARARAGMSWFAILPATAAGAIAARSLLYWTHDRRYGVNVAVVPVAALLATVPLMIAGVPAELVALAPLPIVALFFGWMPHNDLAYDSTALWLHIASGVRGIADRAGRLVPILLIAIPTFAIFIPVATLLSDRWTHALPLTGVCVSLFLSGLGLSSISSAAAPYAVSRPGDSPFRQPQRTEGAGIAAQALVMLGTVIVSIPTLWWAWLAVTREPSLGAAALVAGCATGLAVLGLGLAIGSAVFERRGSALMEFAETAA